MKRLTPEQCATRAQRKKQQWQDPVYRQKVTTSRKATIDGRRGFALTPERKKILKKMRAAGIADPVSVLREEIAHGRHA